MSTNESNKPNESSKPTKLYRLISGSITRYEGIEDQEGSRKVVTYEANGDAGGNLVRLTEKEVQAVGLTRLQEVHGDGESGSGLGQMGEGRRAAVGSPTTSLTGAPAGKPESKQDEQGQGGQVESGSDSAPVRVNDVMETLAVEPVQSTNTQASAPAGTGASTNPAVDRVLANKKAATTTTNGK